jgi:hypothetical protein
MGTMVYLGDRRGTMGMVVDPGDRYSEYDYIHVKVTIKRK